ncbi:MAG TPA: hypothetical protein VNK82_12380 [Terriglobales bacterium]|nr:hypothetical protein [Terriglobales bacterium]
MKCRWLLPAALVIPGVLTGQEVQPAADCSLTRPLVVEARFAAIPAPSARFTAPRLAMISRQHTPTFSYSTAWTPPAFARTAPPTSARPRSNSLPQFLARNPVLARPLVRKLVNQLAGRELFDASNPGRRRLSFSPHVDPGSEEYGLRVKLSLVRPD